MSRLQTYDHLIKFINAYDRDLSVRFGDLCVESPSLKICMHSIFLREPFEIVESNIQRYAKKLSWAPRCGKLASAYLTVSQAAAKFGDEDLVKFLNDKIVKLGVPYRRVVIKSPYDTGLELIL